MYRISQGLELNPKDCWSTHAEAHVIEMEGRQDDGIAFLSKTMNDWTVKLFNPFTPDSAESKIIDKFPKIPKWVKLKNKQHHSKVLLNSFPMNGHTLGFCP